MYPTPRPPAPNGPGHCPRCLQAVLWCVTAANRVPLAVQPQADPAGNQAIRRDHTGRWLVRQLTRDRPVPEHDEVLHMPHVTVCPAPRRAPAARRRTGVRPAPWQR